MIKLQKLISNQIEGLDWPKIEGLKKGGTIEISQAELIIISMLRLPNQKPPSVGGGFLSMLRKMGVLFFI